MFLDFCMLIHAANGLQFVYFARKCNEFEWDTYLNNVVLIREDRSRIGLITEEYPSDSVNVGEILHAMLICIFTLRLYLCLTQLWIIGDKMDRNESVNPKNLPILMQKLIELIGYEDMYILISNYGGQDVYVPKNPQRSKLKKLITLKSLDILSEQYGGIYLTLPTLLRIDNQVRDKKIIKCLESGKSRLEVAKEFGLGVRQVANIKKRHWLM